MLRAVVDPALSVRVLGTRELRYRDAGQPGDDRSARPSSASAPPDGLDRPPHVRAASGIAVIGGRLAVVQDDTSFIALVGPGGALSIPLPRGRDGRRRFEDALGNKQDKLDLESCVVVFPAGRAEPGQLHLGGELWAFGSGATDKRQQVARVGDEVRLCDAAPLYDHVRRAVGSAVNIEGVAVQGDELWLFHRGNTGPTDPGPAVVRFDREPVFAALSEPARSGRASQEIATAFPAPRGCDRYDLGKVDGVPLGFTDAIAGERRVFYLAAAERAPNAIDDGPVTGSQLGVIEPGGRVRAAPLVVDGAPIKAEGLAFDPRDPAKGWIVIDPDDTSQPAPLLSFELVGPW